MVASARVAYLARRGADYGVHTGPVTVDMIKVRQRKRDIVESFRSSGQRRIETTEGVDLLIGEASFTGPKTLKVHLNNGETRQLTANTDPHQCRGPTSATILEWHRRCRYARFNLDYGIGTVFQNTCW